MFLSLNPLLQNTLVQGGFFVVYLTKSDNSRPPYGPQHLQLIKVIFLKIWKKSLKILQIIGKLWPKVYTHSSLTSLMTWLQLTPHLTGVITFLALTPLLFVRFLNFFSSNF